MSSTLTIQYKEETFALDVDPEKTIKWVKDQIKIKTRIPVIQQ